MTEPSQTRSATKLRGTILPFLAVGVLNTAFGYAIFAALVIMGMKSGIALFLATACGVIFNFFTTGRFVFTSRDFTRLPWFVAAYLFVYVANLALLKYLESVRIGPLAAQIICLPLAVTLSYLLLKHLVFRGHGRS